MSKVSAILEQIEQLASEEKALHERIYQIHRIKERLEHELRQIRSPYVVVWDHGAGAHETKYVADRAEAEKRLNDALTFIREFADKTPYQLNQVSEDVYEFTYQPTFNRVPESGTVFIADNPLFESEDTA